jgi:hypothetical protein
MNPDASPRELPGAKRVVPYQILARRLSGRIAGGGVAPVV